MNPQKELEARFPYMFQGKHIGISVARGWLPMFSKLCEAIDNELGDDKQGFHWRQVKEKFGSGRFYFQFGRTKQTMQMDLFDSEGGLSFKAEEKPRKPKSAKQEVQKRIGEMIHKAEAHTNQICIVCGKEAADRDSTGGYLLVLCESHIKQRHEGPDCLDSPWYD
jgi:hypothetical protein